VIHHGPLLLREGRLLRRETQDQTQGRRGSRYWLS
jgi:hypothetical protein